MPGSLRRGSVARTVPRLPLSPSVLESLRNNTAFGYAIAAPCTTGVSGELDRHNPISLTAGVVLHAIAMRVITAVMLVPSQVQNIPQKSPYKRVFAKTTRHRLSTATSRGEYDRPLGNSYCMQLLETGLPVCSLAV